MEDKIALLRERIDIIDEEILARLDRRLSLAVEIAEMKRESGLPMRDHQREHEVVEVLKSQTKGDKVLIERVFRKIIEETTRVQLLWK